MSSRSFATSSQSAFIWLMHSYAFTHPVVCRVTVHSQLLCVHYYSMTDRCLAGLRRDHHSNQRRLSPDEAFQYTVHYLVGDVLGAMGVMYGFYLVMTWWLRV